MPPTRRLTSTAYALLGLLALRAWTTYELSRQMERSLHHLWPRAESNLYGAARALVEHGLATRSAEHHGRRPRALHAITRRGRRALRRWLAEPGAGPVLEFEALVKVFYADQGTREDLLRQLRAIRAWLDASDEAGASLAREYLEGHGPFPERRAVIGLVNRFFWEYGQAIRQWVTWAEREVGRWPETSADWPNDLATYRQALAPYLGRIRPERP